VFNRTLRAQALEIGRYIVRLQLGERCVQLQGLLDTGNALRDRFTDTPVLVCSFSALKPLFSPAADSLPDGLQGPALFEALFPLGLRELRLLPCQTVSSDGMLVAFRPDRAVITGKSGTCELQNILVGIGQMGHHKRAEALLSPAMVRVEVNRKAGNQV
jgi:stage II sporulation protein GA (sporulation sigma-E factor processing peptidase)